MTVRINIDQGALDRVARAAVREAQTDLQRTFDDLGRRYRGRPVAEVKTALRAALSRRGGKATEPELTEWATALSEGTRIVLRS